MKQPQSPFHTRQATLWMVLCFGMSVAFVYGSFYSNGIEGLLDAVGGALAMVFLIVGIVLAILGGDDQ